MLCLSLKKAYDIHCSACGGRLHEGQIFRHMYMQVHVYAYSGGRLLLFMQEGVAFCWTTSGAHACAPNRDSHWGQQGPIGIHTGANITYHIILYYIILLYIYIYIYIYVYVYIYIYICTYKSKYTYWMQCEMALQTRGALLLLLILCGLKQKTPNPHDFFFSTFAFHDFPQQLEAMLQN